MINRKSGLLSFFNLLVVDLPAPGIITINWNFGSILGVILLVQIVTGVLIASRLSFSSTLSFEAVIRIYQDTNYGWLLRLVHASTARLYFFFMYLHIGRGIYYRAYSSRLVWFLGCLIYILRIAVAFLGYVLPWGQISYWAATVITNLVSAIPYLGDRLVLWIWGGYRVGNPTMTRFFTLHYLIPIILLVLVLLHLIFLHDYTSTNPLGSDLYQKKSFHSYYVIKDLCVFTLIILFTLGFALGFGYDFMDPQNWIAADPLVTPKHIKPEWYFLFAYAILRRIPDKLGGILALRLALAFLFIFVAKGSKHTPYSNVYKFIFWSFVSIFMILTWLGSCPAQPPFVLVSQIYTGLYFARLTLLLLL